MGCAHWNGMGKRVGGAHQNGIGKRPKLGGMCPLEWNRQEAQIGWDVPK